MDVLNGVGKQFLQRKVFKGNTSQFRTKGTGDFFHVTQNHIRVIHEILVHLVSVSVGVQMHPRRLNVHHAVPLLQEDNVGGYFRAGSTLKGVVGQANSTQQVCPLCDVLSHGRILLVHGALGSDKGHDTTGTNLVQGSGKEVVVDQEIVLVILLVWDFELTERNITDSRIKEAVGQFRLFKSLHRNRRFLIKLLGDASGNAVQFYTVQLRLGHAVGQHTKEVTDTAGGFQNVALSEIHAFQRLIHGTNDYRRRVKCRQGGFPGGCIFFCCQ